MVSSTVGPALAIQLISPNGYVLATMELMRRHASLRQAMAVKRSLEDLGIKDAYDY